MNTYDISTETYREYIYNFDGVEKVYRIAYPVTLYVKEDDKGTSHRVVDEKDVTHYPVRGWVAIRWFAPEQPVSF